MAHYHQVPTVIDVGDHDRHRPLDPGQALGRPARDDDRGAHAAGGPGAGELHDPRHVGPHGLAVPRQAVDEGGAAGGRRAHGRLDRRRQRRRRCWPFADAVGYPLILKPRSGAGALDTTRVDNRAELDDGAGQRSAGKGVAVDRGRGVRRGPRGLLRHAVDRRARRRSTSSRTTSPTSSTRCAPGGSRRSSSRPTGSTRSATTSSCARWAQRVNEALGIGTSATHMEWFFGPKGLRFSEIGCRPPGVGAWDLYSAGNDLDLYREWANAIVHGQRRRRPLAAVRQPASSRCGRTGTARSPATPASTRSRPGPGSG